MKGRKESECSWQEDWIQDREDRSSKRRGERTEDRGQRGYFECLATMTLCGKSTRSNKSLNSIVIVDTVSSRTSEMSSIHTTGQTSGQTDIGMSRTVSRR